METEVEMHTRNIGEQIKRTMKIALSYGLIPELCDLQYEIMNHWKDPKTKDMIMEITGKIPEDFEDLKYELKYYVNREECKNNPTAIMSVVAWITGYLWAMTDCASVFRNPNLDGFYIQRLIDGIKVILERARGDIIDELCVLEYDIINYWDNPRTKEKLEKIMGKIPEDLKKPIDFYMNREEYKENPTCIMAGLGFITGYIWAMTDFAFVLRFDLYELIKIFYEILEKEQKKPWLPDLDKKEIET